MIKRLFILAMLAINNQAIAQTVIRYNQMGYTTQSPKILILGSKNPGFRLQHYQLLNATTGKPVLEKRSPSEKDFGQYGPFAHSFRIHISGITQPGIYQLVANDSIRSGIIRIGDDVYKGSADFCLRYMRQQRTGFNPYLKDSCHMYDGFVVSSPYAELPDSSHLNVVGGWHDASDYLQYSTTSANATYHLLMAWRDFPQAFGDTKMANGLQGANGLPDVLDEAKWGLDWLQKMHPNPRWMFNQIADDRDHISMRMPGLDSQYGKGNERPVYFIDGKPQQRGKFLNNTTGTSSTAAKFSSAFALAYQLRRTDATFRKYTPAATYDQLAFSSYQYALQKPGVTQTVSVRSPYIYAEDNWTDDMELATSMLHPLASSKKMAASFLSQAIGYAQQEKITPWLGADTASHYQWYPFVNVGHYELAKLLQQPKAKGSAGWSSNDSIVWYMRLGIEKVAQKAGKNAFNRGVPFIWCSNNLTVSFAMQCLWYRQLTGDTQFQELEQANIDWLFGTNPWGTSMVYGLPAWGDTPIDPHSAFTHIKNYPIDGGLIDGPVYTSIFKGLIGLTLYQPDEYAEWQSDLAVYHDDYGDYSTNEPTMDGTASLIYLLAALSPGKAVLSAASTMALPPPPPFFTQAHGAIIRGDSTKKQLTLVFTGHTFAEGGQAILQTLKTEKIKAAFFLTGTFIRQFPALVKQAIEDGHYVGPHSQEHLLYADWKNRDSLLVTKAQFQQDLLANYRELEVFGITPQKAPYFLPPYEWYNSTIADWTSELGIQLINHTPGTLSAADYTAPQDANYRSNKIIFQSIMDRAAAHNGLNGFLLLTHIGAGPGRTNPFYRQLPALVKTLQQQGYSFQELNSLLKH